MKNQHTPIIMAAAAAAMLSLSGVAWAQASSGTSAGAPSRSDSTSTSVPNTGGAVSGPSGAIDCSLSANMNDPVCMSRGAGSGAVMSPDPSNSGSSGSSGSIDRNGVSSGSSGSSSGSNADPKTQVRQPDK